MELAFGALLIGDTIRPDAPAAITALDGMGVETVMATGDDITAGSGGGRRPCPGIKEVRAGLLPEEKAALVAAARNEGRHVAMAGDGINDAPALMAADLGMAMGRGAADIAVEAGDITILSENVVKIVETVMLGRRTLRVISQNLAASTLINVAAVTAAALGWLGPVPGALVHNVGSVLVVLNAARLMGNDHSQ